MDECLFCKIIRGEMPAEFVYQDDDLVAFPDKNPNAPVHLLIVPKKHIKSVQEVKGEDALVLGKMFLAAQKLASLQGVAASGYRLMINNGENAGQEVFHLHMHLLGGKKLAL